MSRHAGDMLVYQEGVLQVKIGFASLVWPGGSSAQLRANRYIYTCLSFSFYIYNWVVAPSGLIPERWSCSSGFDDDHDEVYSHTYIYICIPLHRADMFNIRSQAQRAVSIYML